MINNKQNVAQIVESWTPAIKQITKNRVNESNQDRLEWMCLYAHNHVMALNEENASWTGGTSFPVQTLYNTNGIGNPTLAQQPGMTAADQNSPAAFGSGDKWPSLLPMALQVAARTIGFDLVNNFPFQGPTGVIPFMDYVYSGSKGAYGATYSYDGATANPQVAVGNREPAYELYEAPHAFRCILEVEDPSTSKRDAVKAIAEECENGSTGYITLSNPSTGASMRVQFIGLARLNANPMFKVHPEDKNVALGKVFGANASIDCTVGNVSFTLRRPRLISALEDQILGFTGSGKYDSDRWSGTYMDPKHLYEPMDRATGEMQYPRQMSLQVFTKYVTVGTQSIAVAVTQEQVQDLQKQWGIDVIKLVENAAINELSQSINKHILSRLFALGWKNHVQAYEAEGINLNLDMTKAYGEGAEETISFATYSDEGKEILLEMPVPGYIKYGTGAFENADTMFKKIYVNMLAAGNMIMQRGRRGPANFIVTNWRLATMMQSNAQYSFSPIANTFNQNNGSLYPAGTVAGMTLYVDPMMHTMDTRVLVGRKGDKDEPGVAFCPYILAESVKMITEQTASPKVVVKSRYNLVDLGWYPQLNYVTFYIKTNDTIV